MNRLKRSLCAFMAVVLVFTAACSKSPAPDPKDPTEESGSYESYTAASQEEKKARETFDKFTDDLFRELVSGTTIDLHYTIYDPETFGIARPEPSFGDLSLEDLQESNEDTKEWLATLDAIDRELLTEEQQLTYDVLRADLVTELKSEGLELYYQPLSPTTGYQAQLPVLLAEYSFYTEQDIKDYLALLSIIDESFAQLVEFEKQKSAAGLYLSDSAVDRILAGCRSLIEKPEENYLLEVFNDKIDAFEGLSDDAKAAYKEQNSQIIAEHFIPAYQILIDGLTALKGTGANEYGLCYYDQGKDYYEYLVESDTGSGRTVYQIKDMIQEQLDADLNTMAKLLHDNPDLGSKLGDYSYSETEPEKILEQLKTQITENFPPLPDTTYTVKYVHPSLEDSLSPAFYLTPPIDHYNDNVIYINGSDRFTNQDLYTTLAHEGYPGHLYQNVYFASVNDCPLRSIINYGGYSEGWATYVEYQSYEFDNGLEPNLGKLLAANASATLALYALIDISVNYDGWKSDQVLDFLKEYYNIEDQAVADEIFYAMVDEPANYLQYYVGCLEILQLKKMAKQSMMFRYSDLRFNQMFLDIGPASFPVIEKWMTKWIEEKKY